MLSPVRLRIRLTDSRRAGGLNFSLFLFLPSFFSPLLVKVATGFPRASGCILVGRPEEEKGMDTKLR